MRRSNPGEREIRDKGNGLPREPKMSMFARNDVEVCYTNDLDEFLPFEGRLGRVMISSTSGPNGLSPTCCCKLRKSSVTTASSLKREEECRVDFSLPKKNVAFTLAEVLIALVVIGIIAAITLTTVMPNIQERANSQRQANIVYKITQATDLMKANGAMVEGFESTDKFVDELQKYLKIMKRCDSEHIADC